MNLLMISVDDLRPLLRCHGHPHMHTPNFDRLAAGGVLFENAMCQVPVCGASRASLMTGLRPTPTRFLNHMTYARDDAPGTPTLLHLLRDSGYHLTGAGKIFHNSDDCEEAWTEKFMTSLGPFPAPYYTDWALNHPDFLSGRSRRPAYEIADIPDEAQPDGDTAAWLLPRLRAMAGQPKGAQPWCAVYGSINVHLPFKAPQKYWDLYPPEAVELKDYDLPREKVPPLLWHNFWELRNYAEIPKEGPVSREQAHMLTRGYMAGVSYLDAQLGKLRAVLDETNAWENTAVVLWVDHGWVIGEHGLWCKHNLYEVSCHVPMMIRLPDAVAAEQGIAPGTRVSRVTENLDLFPTLCELMGLPAPDHLQGRSLVPLMRDPGAEWDAYAASRFGAAESLRTDEWRYVERLDEAGEITDRALFDHRRDHLEQVNVAGNPANEKLIATLSARLAAIQGR